MGIDFAGDLVESLSTRDHGSIVSHGVAGATEGIFNREFLAVDPGGAVEVDGSEPAVYVPTGWAQPVGRGDTITIDGVDYTVATAPEPDGVGLSRIALQAG